MWKCSVIGFSLCMCWSSQRVLGQVTQCSLCCILSPGSFIHMLSLLVMHSTGICRIQMPNMFPMDTLYWWNMHLACNGILFCSAFYDSPPPQCSFEWKWEYTCIWWWAWPWTTEFWLECSGRSSRGARSWWCTPVSTSQSSFRSLAIQDPRYWRFYVYVKTGRSFQISCRRYNGVLTDLETWSHNLKCEMVVNARCSH